MSMATVTRFTGCSLLGYTKMVRNPRTDDSSQILFKNDDARLDEACV
jgi:hypothetical protein